MSIEMIRGIYDYHRWANRALFDIALARGDEAVERDLGPPWSFPSIRRMFAHIYGADAIWLARWRGAPLAAFPGGDLPSMAALRERWDAANPMWVCPLPDSFSAPNVTSESNFRCMPAAAGGVNL